MLEHINMYDKITCDKCGISQTELKPESGRRFFETGWRMNPRAKKYTHLCSKCLKNSKPFKCIWCGKKYEEHRSKPLSSGAVPKMPCLGLKSGFRKPPGWKEKIYDVLYLSYCGLEADIKKIEAIVKKEFQSASKNNG